MTGGQDLFANDARITRESRASYVRVTRVLGSTHTGSARVDRHKLIKHAILQARHRETAALAAITRYSRGPEK